jgi:hypothetical protein
MSASVGFDWERGDFGRGHSSHNDKVGRAPHWTGQIQAGRGGRLMGLGVHGCERVERALTPLPPPHPTPAKAGVSLELKKAPLHLLRRIITRLPSTS